MKLYRLCGAFAVALSTMVGAGTAPANPRGLWLAEDGAKVTSHLRSGALRDVSESQIADRPDDGRGLDRQE